MPLSKALFNVKGEFYKGERIYNVNHSAVYFRLLKDPSKLSDFIRKVVLALQVFSKLQIVHFDLKPENILVETDENNDIVDIRIIDLGSAFQLEDIGNLTGATPEYLPPEVLIILNNSFKKGNNSQIENLSELVNSWSVDIWSLGAIILEIIIGLPHWISYKCKVSRGGKDVFRQGFFSSKCRDLEKIRQKQRDLPMFFEEKLYNLVNFKSHESCNDLIDLLSKMMAWSPKDRISPDQLLHHPFIVENQL